jgi:hypothetical protein
VDRLIQERGLNAQPWILDLHDAFYYEVPDKPEDIQGMQQVVEDAFRELNERLRPLIPLKGETKTFRRWGEAL